VLKPVGMGSRERFRCTPEPGAGASKSKLRPWRKHVKFTNNRENNALISSLQAKARECESLWTALSEVGGRFLVIHGRCEKTPFSGVFENGKHHWSDQMERAAKAGALDHCAQIVGYRKSDVLALASHSLALQQLQSRMRDTAKQLESIMDGSLD